MKKLILSAILVAGMVHFAHAQQLYAPGTLALSCNAVTTTGACTALAMPGNSLAVGVTWQLFYDTGTASAISVTLRGSNDDSTWTVLDTNATCVTTGASGCSRSLSIDGAYKYLDCDPGTYTKGTTNNLSCGITVNPNGGGGGGGIASINGDTTPAQVIAGAGTVSCATTSGTTTCTGTGGGAVSSVTGAGTVSCSPTTGDVTCTGTSGGTVNSGTATHLGYYATSTTAISDMGADFTFSTHTLTGGASAILDLSSISSFKPPGGGGTFTLGSTNQNWATLGTGIVKNTTTTGALSDAASSDVIGLWASGSCSGLLKSDNTCSAPSVVGNHNIDLIAGVLQGSGCSINNSFLAAAAVGCYSLAGSATTPQEAFPQFATAGVIGTGTTLMIGPKTLPSNYTTNANLVLNFGIGDHVDTTGAATFSVRYSCAAVPAVIQPTYYTTDYGTGSLNVSGTIDNSVAGTATITPNTGGSPACAAGNQVWFAVYLSAKTATNAVYLSQLYMSY